MSDALPASAIGVRFSYAATRASHPMRVMRDRELSLAHQRTVIRLRRNRQPSQKLDGVEHHVRRPIAHRLTELQPHLTVAGQVEPLQHVRR